MKVAVLPLLALALSLSFACTIEAGSGRVAGDAPDRTTFAIPGKILSARCGSLDCHGDAYRNYRLFGYGSARLAEGDGPDFPDTTDDELEANYDATVGLEPERTTAVANGTKRPESLTLVRKARGSEKHVGGQRIVPGSEADSCLVGWLTGAPDEAACTAAMDAIVDARTP